jgi:BirA family transcriptional regulator, biotin operon repressor / biotin---[acetyl-CoA-carboxylase] ligase
MNAATEKLEKLKPLDAKRIGAMLVSQPTDFSILIFDQLDSTSTHLLQLASQGARHATCVASETQHAGRGRHGRNWISSPGGSLTFSLLWHFAKPISRLEGLSLAVGVAMVRALREQGLADVMLKWPNDVLHHFHKLAGVLIETGNDHNGSSYAVIGIGVNIQLPNEAREKIGQAVTDWASLMQTSVDRNALLVCLLIHLSEVLKQFEQGGLTTLRDEWMSYHAYQNKNVRLRWPDNSEVHGSVNGIAENGALLLETSAGEKQFSVGEISLRAVEKL